MNSTMSRINVLRLHHLFTLDDNKHIVLKEPLKNAKIVYYGYILTSDIECIDMCWPSQEDVVLAIPTLEQLGDNVSLEEQAAFILNLRRKDGGILPLSFNIFDKQLMASYHEYNTDPAFNYFGVVEL